MTEKFLFIAIFFVGVLLFGTLNRKGGNYDFRTALDRHIPFVPEFSVPYLLLFPYIVCAAALLFESAFGTQYFAVMAFAMCSAAISWFLFPSKMARPSVSRNKFFDRTVHKIYEGDAHANAFPSSHVFTSLITSYYLASTFAEFFFPIWITGISIALSTVFIKQHFAVDVLAGVLWAYAGVGVAHIFFA